MVAELNEEKSRMKKIAEMNQYDTLQRQNYTHKMKSEHARLLFRIRGRITTIKDHRRYGVQRGKYDVSRLYNTFFVNVTR